LGNREARESLWTAWTGKYPGKMAQPLMISASFNVKGFSSKSGGMSKEKRCVSKAVPLDVEVIAVAAGGAKDAGHSAAVDINGGVWTWGCDRWQQLGLGSSDTGCFLSLTL